MKTILLVVLVIIVSIAASAQSGSPSTEIDRPDSVSSTQDTFHGFNAYTSISGVVTGSGSLTALDSSVGYDFNRNFGIFGGAPVYFTNGVGAGSSSVVAGMGDAYIGAALYLFPKLFRYSTDVTVGLPTGSVAKGFSPGTVTADWSNHFRRSFGKLTPSFSAGIANTVGAGIGALPNSQQADRSLAARGTFVHMEEGADFDITSRIYVGGEGYHILPFANSSATNLSTSIERENGIDVWAGFMPNKVVTTEIGYSRSLTFALNSVSFRMKFNVGRILRGSSRQ
jgi:hypothetical protein